MSASARKGVNRGAEEGALGRHAFRPVLPGAQPPLPTATAPSCPPHLPVKAQRQFRSSPSSHSPRRIPPLMPAAGGPPQACSSPSSGSWASRPPARGPAPRKQASAPGSGFPSPGCGGSRPSKPGAGSLSRRPPGRGWLGGRGVLSPRAPRLRLGPRSAERCPARPSGRWDRPVPRRRAGP